MSGYELAIWTVYDRPTGYPNNYVARRFIVRNGEPCWTAEHIVCDELDLLRQHMEELGLYRLDRMPGDEPKILETWI